MNKNHIRADRRKYHFVYETRCTLTNRYYRGIHSTDNIDDGYLGSGKILRRSILKHGKHNHTRTILEFCESRKSLLTSEIKWIAEVIDDQNCMNITKGGEGVLAPVGCVVVNDAGHRTRMSIDDPRMLSGEYTSINKNKTLGVIDGKCVLVSKNDPRFLDGLIIHISSGKTTVKDSTGNIFRVSTSDPRFISGELKSTMKGTIPVEFEGRRFRVAKDDPRYLSGEYQAISKGQVMVRDRMGHTFRVAKDDPRYLSGELIHINKGKFLAKDRTGKKYSIYKDDPRYLSGELIHFRKKWMD